jgi:L-amino acid N-acyltransferase YncA
MTTPELRVRPVRPADAAELAELLNAIIARRGTTALETPYSAQALDDAYLTGPEVICCFVAEGADGRLVGFQTLGRDPRLPEGWGDIGTFARVGGTQRGVGRALFAATVEHARRIGIVGINATIRADNTGGLTFYGRMGFRDHGVTPAVPLKDGAPVDRVHKRLELISGATTA